MDGAWRRETFSSHRSSTERPRLAKTKDRADAEVRGLHNDFLRVRRLRVYSPTGASLTKAWLPIDAGTGRSLKPVAVFSTGELWSRKLPRDGRCHPSAWAGLQFWFLSASTHSFVQKSVCQNTRNLEFLFRSSLHPVFDTRLGGTLFSLPHCKRVVLLFLLVIQHAPDPHNRAVL
jgi:hypothetical protein